MGATVATCASACSHVCGGLAAHMYKCILIFRCMFVFNRVSLVAAVRHHSQMHAVQTTSCVFTCRRVKKLGVHRPTHMFLIVTPLLGHTITIALLSNRKRKLNSCCFEGKVTSRFIHTQGPLYSYNICLLTQGHHSEAVSFNCSIQG